MPTMQSLRLTALLAGSTLVAPACGDDTSPSSGSNDGSSSSGVDESSSTAPADGSSTSESSSGEATTMLADTSTGVLDESSSSSTGAPNNPPIAIDDLYVMAMADAPLAITADAGVLANDSDPDGDAITVDDFDAASSAGGTVVIEDDGALAYTPPSGFWGEDGFDYTIVDDGGATASAHVRVMVAPATVALGEVTEGIGGFMIEGIAAGDQAGYAVAGGGDIDGDGLADVIVGAWSADVDGNGEGRVFVVYGKPDGASVALSDVLDGTGGFVIDGIDDFDRTGFAVASGGDVDGDGLADVIIGAPQADAVADNEGRVFVVFGKGDQDPVALATLEADAAGFVIEGIAADDLAGWSVGGGSDVDGDGRDDVIVGAPQADGNGVGNSGRVFVVLGKPDSMPVDLVAVAAGNGGFAIDGIALEDHAGDAVAGIGDVDGDGLEDLLVGVPQANAGGGNSGRSFVVLGKTDGTTVELADVLLGDGGFAIDGAAGLDQLGDAVSGAGDVDGDGLADVIVGAPGAENDTNLQGRSYVVYGKNDGTAVTADDLAAGIGGFAIDGEAEGDLSGWSVGGGVDVDGDGRSDVLVGAQNADFAAVVAGRSYVIYGGAGGPVVALGDVAMGIGGFAIDGEMSNDVSGWSIAGGGDVSGDGLGDLLIGAYGAPGGDDVGRSYVVFGGDFAGHVVQPGGAGDDEILGSAAVDTLLGGDGNDILHGLGGFDVIYGGPGDDAIVLSGPELFRIDGGTGQDAIVLDGADLALDLPGFFECAVVGIEAVDLTGVGDNSLFLETRDLRALSKTSNTLLVLGDDGDQVVADFTGAGFVDLGSANGFHSWSDGVLTLAVADEVEAFVEL
jgi:Bacterial Ig domain/FG-GAP repeat